MWFVFHHGAKTRPVRGGARFFETCPECHEHAQFHEVEVSQRTGVFFIDVDKTVERAYRCGACGEVFDLRDDADAARGARAATPEPDRADPDALLARLERDHATEQARRRADEHAKAVRIEDELAELKKRVGR